MKDWEARQARGRAIMDWLDRDEDPGPLHILADDDASAAQFLIDAIQSPPRDTQRDGLDTWGFVG